MVHAASLRACLVRVMRQDAALPLWRAGQSCHGAPSAARACVLLAECSSPGRAKMLRHAPRNAALPLWRAGQCANGEVPRSKLGGGTCCSFFLGFLGTKVTPSSLLPHGAVFDSWRLKASQFLLVFLVFERYSFPLCSWVRNP
ncbi:uncharacterized protein DS421_10g303710 [Arachis hypogaea]|nr:uncharacterized protein DS421_10g303710 [Arachis hypogaea]